MSGKNPAAPSTAVDEATVLRALTTERLALCTRLDGLDDTSWSKPTPCTGWTVKDVVAHLVLGTRQTAIDFVRGMLRYRGNFDRMNAEQARSWAARHETAELLAQVRDTAGSPKTSFGSSLRDSLIDVIVHTQDIARPLGGSWSVAPDHVAIALDHALASRWYGAPKRFTDTTLVATDVDWTWGSGRSLITGPCLALLLVATARPEGVANLTGPGLEALTAKLAC